MALFGVVFALGAGSAAAQVTVTVPATVDEGGLAEVKVSAKVSIPADTEAGAVTVTLSVNTSPDADDPGPNTAEDSDHSFVEAAVELNFPANPATATAALDRTLTGSIYVQTTNDLDAEDERVTFQATVTENDGTQNQGADTDLALAATGNKYTLKIDDDETQTYVLALAPASQKPEEGDDVTVSLKAMPAHDNETEVITLHLDQTPPFSVTVVAAGTNNGTPVSGTSVTIGDGTTDSATEATITVETNPNDKNRTDDTIILTAYTGTAGNAKPADTLEIKLTDLHKLPAVTAKAILLDEDGDALEDDMQPEDGVMSIMEGQMIDIEIAVVDKDGKAAEAAEALMVSLMPTGDANSQDYRLNMHPVAIKSGDMTGTVRLTAVEDQDIGMETLMFDADVAGAAANGSETRMSMGVLSLEIMDTTMRQVEAKTEAELMPLIYGAIDEGDGDDDMFSPGETIEIDASMLFMPTDYSLSYGAESDMMDVAGVETSGSMVTVTGMMAGGPAHITITATATGMMSGAKPLPQTSPNVAQVIFPVTVELAELMVELSMDEMEMNIAEGMGAMITATANRPVTMDTTVELIQTEGTASPADYMHEPLMIMSGMTEGTTMLMAVEDDMMEEGETLTLEGRVGEMKTNTVMFYIWDAAVPALPLIAQLLLAAFLALGGYRRYLRR